MSDAGAQRDAPQVIAFPPLLPAATLVAGLIAHAVYPIRPLPALTSRLAGALAVLAGLALASRARSAMRRAGTNIDPRMPSTALVVDGPFRFSRNPLYIALTALYAGVALLVDALWPLVLLVPMLVVFDRGIVAREERYLERKFGEPYLRYKQRVRRWI